MSPAALAAVAPAHSGAVTPFAASKKEIGARIRTCREAKGLTQAVLAGYLEKTRAAITQWEAGDSSPPIDLFPTLAFHLGTTKAYIAFGDREGASPTSTTIPIIEFEGEKTKLVGDLSVPNATYLSAQFKQSASVRAFILPNNKMYDGHKAGDVIFIDENAKEIQGTGERYLMIDQTGSISVVQVVSIPGSSLIQIKLWGQTVPVERRAITPFGRVVGSIKMSSLD